MRFPLNAARSFGDIDRSRYLNNRHLRSVFGGTFDKRMPCGR